MNSEATIAFIRQNADADVRQLALRGTKAPEVDLPFALDQIAGRQTARHKLPSWAAIDGIVYPPHLSMEQCSSEQTALYKCGVMDSLPVACHETLIDLTGGFGVDFSFLARGFQRAVYVERQEHLCAIARENFRLLGLIQAEVVCGDSTDYLQTMPPVDFIYADPARRDNHGARTYGISDCTPDVLALRDQLLSKARQVLLKLSPMLDWRKAVSDLGEQYVREVHIVSVGNECKELLLLLGSGSGQRLFCVNDDQVFEPTTQTAQIPQAALSPRYLYEPNASIMKAGCFTELSQHYGVAPIAHDSHLFVSADYVGGFPGRSFQIDAVTTMNKRDLKETLQGLTQANITVRNFPLSVAELRRRLKLSEGGSTYIFATTLATGDRRLFVCHKVV